MDKQYLLLSHTHTHPATTWVGVCVPTRADTAARNSYLAKQKAAGRMPLMAMITFSSYERKRTSHILSTHRRHTIKWRVTPVSPHTIRSRCTGFKVEFRVFEGSTRSLGCACTQQLILSERIQHGGREWANGINKHHTKCWCRVAHWKCTQLKLFVSNK